MADDQVKYSELLVKDEDVFANLIKELGDVKTKISELKTEASGLSGVLKNISTATREQQQATAANAKSVELLAQKTKDLAATKKNLEDATKRFGNLTDEEVGRLDRLATKLKFSSQWQEATAKLVDTTNMSYNEMKATLAVLTNALHTFGTEEKKNSDEAKALENAIERVRDAMKELDDRTKAVAAAEKQMAEEAKKAAQEEEEAYKASQKEAAKRVKTQEELHNARQKEIEDAFKARDAEMAKMKLTEEEYNSVKQLKSALAGTAQEQIAAMQNLEIQNKSYNELYQTYNAIKDVLKAMTTVNTEAGKAMTAQAAKIYDTMNELQKATGKYTLQVGKYRAAFDGLGYSFQQILREAPSALNLNQFFLAISNNIPQFIDQLKAFRDEQTAIKKNLADMTKGTKEYAEQQEKQMSVGKKLLTTFLSWQTAVLVGVMLLRKFGSALIDWVATLFKGAEKIKEIKNELSKVNALAQFQVEVLSRTQKELAELDMIVDRLRDIRRGTDEWDAGIANVNKITGQNLNSVTTTYDTLKKITDEYKNQAIQIAKNNVIAEMVGKSMANEAIRRVLYELNDLNSAASILGIKEGDDTYETLKRAFEYRNTKPVYPSSSVNIEPQLRSAMEGYVVGGDNAAYEQAVTNAWEDKMASYQGPTQEEIDKENKRVADLMERGMTMYKNLVNEHYETLSSDAINGLLEEMKIVRPENGKGASVKDLVDDLKTLKRAWEDAQIANIEDEYVREEAAEMKRHERFIKDKEAELKLVENDAERKVIIQKQIEEETNTHDRLMLEIDEKYRQEMIKRRNEEEAKAEKDARDNAKKQYKALSDSWQEERAKLIERGAKKKELIQAEIDAEIARLNTMLTVQRSLNGEIMTDEEKAKIEEWIRLLNQLKASGNFNLINAGQIFGNGGANIGKKEKGNYTSISDILWPDLNSDQTSALNSVFDQAKEALNGWMQAKVDAANQSKELADDEVAAAENALNREIELRNQGYANDVALKERELADAKKRQKEAAELQQKAKKDQLAVNTAMEASSMAVAVANLFKDFPLYAAIPLTAVLLGAFAAAKVQSFQAIKSTKYREGGVMLLEGGSHQSGHDVNLGIGPDGSNLRAEGGEYFAVINKRNSRRYGSEIPNIVNALNSGMFEDRYIKTSDAMGMLPRIIKADDGSTVDLSAVESGVGALVKQGERTWSTEGEYRVMRYKNLTRRVRVG